MSRPGERPHRKPVDVRRVDEGEDEDGTGGTNMCEPRRPRPRPNVGGGAMALPVPELAPDLQLRLMEAANVRPITQRPARPTREGREGDSQPMPVVNDAPSVQSQVIADIEKRIELGIERYGTALQPFNGRNMLKDAYEEALDLAVYLKGALIEREITEARMVSLVTPKACPPHPYTSRTCRFQPGHEGDHLDALGDWWTGKTSAP